MTSARRPCWSATRLGMGSGCRRHRALTSRRGRPSRCGGHLPTLRFARIVRRANGRKGHRHWRLPVRPHRLCGDGQGDASRKRVAAIESMTRRGVRISSSRCQPMAPTIVRSGPRSSIHPSTLGWSTADSIQDDLPDEDQTRGSDARVSPRTVSTKLTRKGRNDDRD
jgi:hypothetical protein